MPTRGTRKQPNPQEWSCMGTCTTSFTKGSWWVTLADRSLSPESLHDPQGVVEAKKKVLTCPPPQLAAAWQVPTSSLVFGLSHSLLQRTLVLPKFRDDPHVAALAFACFNLAIKFEDGTAPSLKDLCSTLGTGLCVDPQVVSRLEVDLLNEFDWCIDFVTPASLLAQLKVLCPKALWLSIRADIYACLDAFYVSPSWSNLPSSVVKLILSTVALFSAEVSAACGCTRLWDSWVPKELLPDTTKSLPPRIVELAAERGRRARTGNRRSEDCDEALFFEFARGGAIML
jgi:hypothetical protein